MLLRCFYPLPSANSVSTPVSRLSVYGLNPPLLPHTCSPPSANIRFRATHSLTIVVIAGDLCKCASAATRLLTSAFVARQTAACSILRISLHLPFDREFCRRKKAAPRLKKGRFRYLSVSQAIFFSAAKMRHHRYPLRGCFGAQLVPRLRRHFLLFAKKRSDGFLPRRRYVHFACKSRATVGLKGCCRGCSLGLYAALLADLLVFAAIAAHRPTHG